MREAVLPWSPVELDPLDPSESFVDSCAAGFSADLAESYVASCAAASGFCGEEMYHIVKAHFSISRQQARGHWPLVATSRHHAQFGHLFRMVPHFSSFYFSFFDPRIEPHSPCDLKNTNIKYEYCTPLRNNRVRMRLFCERFSENEVIERGIQYSYLIFAFFKSHGECGSMRG